MGQNGREKHSRVPFASSLRLRVCKIFHREALSQKHALWSGRKIRPSQKIWISIGFQLLMLDAFCFQDGPQYK